MQRNLMDTTLVYTKNPWITKTLEPKILLKKFGF